MNRLLREMFRTPEAEAEPGAWATRLMAHFGLGAVLWLLLVAFLGPWWALGFCAAGYALWKAMQWTAGWRMAWDAALDWTGFVLAGVALAFVWQQDALQALGAALAAMAIMSAGVRKRQIP